MNKEVTSDVGGYVSYYEDDRRDNEVHVKFEKPFSDSKNKQAK